MKKLFSRDHIVPFIYILLLVVFSLVFTLVCNNFPAILSAIGSVLTAAKSIIYGIVISLVLLPIVKLYEKLAKKLFCRKREHPRLVATLGVVCAELALVITVAVIVVLMLPLLTENFSIFRDNLASYIFYAQSWVETHIVIFDWMEPFYEAIIRGIQDSIFQFSIALNNLIPQLLSIATGIVSEVWSFVIGLIISIYLLSSRKMLYALFNKITAAITPKKFRRGVADFGTLIYTNFTEFFSSRLIDSLIVGVIFYFLCWMMNIPFYALISLAMFVANFIPVFGPMVGTLVGTLVVLLVKPDLAVYFFLIAVAINLLDRLLIEPRLMSKRLRQNVGVELVLLIVAFAAWGIVGIFVAIPLYITIRTVFVTFVDYRLQKRSLPVDAYDYIGSYPEEECLREEARMDEENLRRYKEERAARKASSEKNEENISN